MSTAGTLELADMVAGCSGTSGYLATAPPEGHPVLLRCREHASFIPQPSDTKVGTIYVALAAETGPIR